MLRASRLLVSGSCKRAYRAPMNLSTVPRAASACAGGREEDARRAAAGGVAASLAALALAILLPGEVGVVRTEEGAHDQDVVEDREEMIHELSNLLGSDMINLDDDDRRGHGKPFNSYHHIDTYPELIVTPHSTAEVAAIVKVCAKHKVPVVPYGGATSLEGQLLATEGGVSIDFSNMKRILRFSKNDHDVTVQPGLGYLELNEYLGAHGMWFPLDPGPGASLGGMCACRCSGSTAVRYGTMRENVINVTAVTPDGNIIKTASRATKSAAGYDLTRLFVGSEGTLGVITELTLRVHKIPSHMSAMRVSFPSIRDAAATVQDVLAAGIQVGRAELMDDVMMKIINAANGKEYPLETTLLFEFSGESLDYVHEVQNQVNAIANAHYGEHVHVATNPAECKQMWKERKEALWAAEAQYPDCECMITDVCVPISRLADLIAASKIELDASWLPCPLVAHTGDGNFHVFIMFKADDPKDLAEARRLSSFMVHKALEMEGTCTGEHGIGAGKIQYLQREAGPAGIALMSKIKKAVDPDNLMNPGKMLPQSRDPTSGRLRLSCG